MPDINADVDLHARIAQLEQRLLDCEREFATLTQIAQTVESTLDLQQLLDTVLDQLKTLVDYDGAGIVLVENDIARFFDYRGPLPRDLVLSWRFPVTVAGYQLATQNAGALVVADMLIDSDISRVYRTSLGELVHYFDDVRSWMSVPLITRGHVIGFLRVSHPKPDHFTPQHVRLAEAVAGHAAIAIENARHLRDEHARLEEVERRRVVAESLRGILAILNSNTPPDQMLDYILEQACHTLGTDTAAIYRLNVETQLLIPRATRNIPSEVVAKLQIPVGQGIVGQAILHRRPVAVTDFDSVPISITTVIPSMDEWREMVAWAKRNFVAMLGIPLFIKDQPYGGISLFFRELCCPLTPEDIALAMSFGDQAALAIENARLYTSARRLAVVEERQRLARDLHDSVSQALYGIELGAQTAKELLDTDPSPTKLAEPIDYIQSLAQAGLAEMRALIFNLRPEALETEGLVAGLRKQVASLRARHRLDVQANLIAEPTASIQIKEAVYRIAQEALHNIVKHARAQKVTLSLVQNDGHLILDVRDDGIGFDPAQPHPGHLGLASMCERTAQFNGKLAIESTPGNGAHVHAEIPITGA